MDQVIELLVGILVAAGVFAAVLFSGTQAVRGSGTLAAYHGAAAVLSILGMAALSLAWWNAAQGLGVPVAVTGVMAALYDRGLNRVLPLFHVLFGAALFLRLPMGG